MMPHALAILALFALQDGPFRDLGFDAARAAAKAQEKVVFVDFFTTWCGPCKKLDATTWKDERVVAWLGDRTVALRLDAEKERELAKRYRVAAYPTLLFVDAEGHEVGRLVGYLDADAFLAKAPETLSGISELDRVEARLKESPDDPSLRQQRGELLMREGRNEEALAELLWCFDHGNEHDRGYAGVRVSFLLTSLSRLGRAYPTALEALRERERAAREAVLAGHGGVEEAMEAMDVAALNRELHQPGRTLELWETLRDRGELLTAREALFDHVLDLLLEAGRYEDVIEGAGDVMQRVRRRIETFERTRDEAKESGELGTDYDASAFMLQTALNEGAKYYRAALATGRVELADSISSALLEVSATARAFALFARTAAEAGDFARADALLERGSHAVPDDSESVLRSARRRVDRLRERAQTGKEPPEGGR